MLLGTEKKTYKANITPEPQSQAPRIIVNALVGLSGRIQRHTKEEKTRLLKEDRIFTDNMIHQHNIQVEQVNSNTDLAPQDRLKQLQDIGTLYKSKIQERGKGRESEVLLKGFQHLEMGNLKIYNATKKHLVAQYEHKAVKDFADKLGRGVYDSVDSAMDYIKTAKLDKRVSRGDVEKGFEDLGTRRAIHYIEQSTIDGVPTELLKFNKREDVAKAFYGEMGDSARIPQGVISAIANAHRWDVGNKRRIARDKQVASDKALRLREKELKEQQNELLYRLNREVRNSNNNGSMVSDSVSNSLSLLEGTTTGATNRRVRDLKDKVADNKEIMTFIGNSFDGGKSKQEVEQGLSKWSSVSSQSKNSLMATANKKILNNIDSTIADIYSSDIPYDEKRQQLSDAYTRYYQWDDAEANKKASSDIKSELSTLNSSTLPNLILKLDSYISSRTENGHEMPLEEKKFLNELQSMSAIMANGGESKQELSNMLQVKKREYVESKRKKDRSFVASRATLLKEGLTDGLWQNDNFASNRDINRFIISNPDIPTERLVDRFNNETVDLDTSSFPFKSWKVDLADSVKNGKLLIPDDRELGERSISTELKNHISEKPDDITEFMIKQSDKVVKSLEVEYGGEMGKISDFYFTFNKVDTGLQAHIYGTLEGTGSEELLGIVSHDELINYLQKVR